jgi:CRISPR-associated Cas5-like protein
MPIVIVEAVATVASWRPPEAQTYHRTLPLPPYTAQVGMLGAALGVGLTQAYQFVQEHALKLGVGGWHQGKARDLWKYQKLKEKQCERDILLREYWIDSRLALVIEAPDAATSERIAVAYQAPSYPLTAGTSDALLHPLAVRVEDANPRPTRRLIHTLVYAEISPLYQPFEKIKDIPLTRTVQAPMVENLPTGFVFSADGTRQRAGRALVSFVADGIELDGSVRPVVGYPLVPRSNPLRAEYHRWKEGLEWTIPVHRYDWNPTQADASSKPPSPSGPKRERKPKATGNT